MKAPALTYSELRALKPCTEDFARVTKLMGGARKWDGKKIGAAQARKAGATYDDIVWAASALAATNKDIERRLRLWFVDCAANVLSLFEQERPKDGRPRNALIATRAFVRGEIDDAEWTAARDAAWAAARDAARDAEWAAARAAARAAAWAAEWAAARDAEWAAAWAAAGDAERNWQFDRLIEWLSHKEPEDWPLPDKPKAKKAA